ncbi:MAG: AMP-binding protein [Desulfarculaceae bacterium]|jgi:crotonobetaine/carnitine-CoA ligase
MTDYPRPERTLRELIADRAAQTPRDIFAVFEEREISYGELADQVAGLASGLLGHGLKPGDRVAVMMANHPDHIVTFLALASLGCVWIPVNVHLRGPSLEYILGRSQPRAVIIDEVYWETVESLLPHEFPQTVILRQASKTQTQSCLDFAELINTGATHLPGEPKLNDLRCISFTSGTTGPPKGVLMTERMLQVCAIGAGLAASVQPGDVFLVWEPLYHNSGAQICILALQCPVKLIMTPRFSASNFWSQIKRHHVTKIHYLGGIVDILLKQSARSEEAAHQAGIAFGGGCHREKWSLFEQRFGVKIQECYGLTEASGFSTINTSGKIGSIGKPLPYFEVQIIDEAGRLVSPNEKGEIIIHEKEPGLITQGYLDNPEATAEALKDGCLHTGDLGSYDDDGDFFYLGRIKDSIRRRGENISAWEVERVLNRHPDVQESAVIGVAADIGEQELKAFIKLRDGSTLSPLELVKWCEPSLPYYQIPRFIEFIDSFEKTPTERIRKENLPADSTATWDLEKSGYQPQRR